MYSNSSFKCARITKSLLSPLVTCKLRSSARGVWQSAASYIYIHKDYILCMYVLVYNANIRCGWGLVTNGKWRKHTNNYKYNKKWKFSHLPIISSSWVGDAQKHTNRCIECTLWLQSSFRMKAAYFDVCIMDLRHIFVCEYGYSIWYINTPMLCLYE